MQYGTYGDFLGEPSVAVLLLAYLAWTLMSIALKKFVIDAKGYGFKSTFTTAPLLGLVIYFCINLALMAIEPEWGMQLAFTDVVFGTSMFAFVTLITVMFKDFFD